ncbi:Putative adenylate cyclase regulatory protein [Linum perenne]
MQSSGSTTSFRSGLSFFLNSAHRIANFAKHSASSIGQSGTSGSRNSANSPFFDCSRSVGTDSVEALRVDMEGENFVLRNEHLKELSRLRYMVLRNARLSGSFKDVLPNIRWLGLHKCDSVPSDLNLKKLVFLRLEDCPVRDGWKGWNEIKVSRKLKCIYLRRCLNLNTVPDLSNCADLEIIAIRECRNMRGELDISNLKNLKVIRFSHTKITKLKGEIEKLQNLQELNASDSSLIQVPAGISKLSSLELLNLELTPPKKLEMTEMLPNSLKRLAISSSSLSSLPSSLTYLQIWYCEHLPNLANLTNLLYLKLRDVSIGEILGLGELKLMEALNIERAPNLINLDGLESLVLLKQLRLKGCTILEKLPSLAALSRLELLQIESCPVITEIRVAEGLWESLSELDVRRCSSLTGIGALHCMVNLEILVLFGIGLTESVPSSLSMFTKLRTLGVSKLSLQQFPDLSNLKNIRDLRIINCNKLIQVTGLDTLESLEFLTMVVSGSIKKLPDLSGLVKLKTLDVSWCTQLTEIRGLEKLELLEALEMSSCESIKELPNLSGLKKLNKLRLKGCRQLKEVKGIEELESLQVFEADKRLKVKYLLKRVSRYGKQLVTMERILFSVILADSLRAMILGAPVRSQRATPWKVRSSCLLSVLSQTGCGNPLLSSLSSFLKALHCFFFFLLLYIRRTGTWKNCRLKLNSLPSDLFSIVNNLLQAVLQLLEWIPNQISTVKF